MCPNSLYVTLEKLNFSTLRGPALFDNAKLKEIAEIPLTLFSMARFVQKPESRMVSFCGKTVYVRKSAGEIIVYFFILDLPRQKF